MGTNVTNHVLTRTEEDITFVTEDIKVEYWMINAPKQEGVYVVCRDYSGSSFPLMWGHNVLMFDLQCDACGAALICAEIEAKQ
ncbi:MULTISPECIES: hypothetical protein [unclassified Maridesulfovibrio]|uniref:hypothetical protein n=1 Tax=unclassified Maridesulfovibrio TaxID=2794999 RepID=UPI003B419C35